MKKRASSLSALTKQAQILENRINQPLTNKQLWVVAQEAAFANHVLVTRFMISARNNRAQLTGLSRKFSQIENAAIGKFYGKDSVGPSQVIL
ncbi:MAG: hypothetical protein AB1489_22930 [Acidobacteriota bacterium]